MAETLVGSNPAVHLVPCVCPECHAAAEYEIEAGYWIGCVVCQGWGEVLGCARCRGTGYVEVEDGPGYDYDTCPVCKGHGR